MSLLEIEKLSAGYGKKNIISDISLKLEKGQRVGILGPNGCGKSTLMKALCKGISYQGKVLIEGQDIAGWSEKTLARSCSYVPQQSGLSIDITAVDAVLMGFQPYLKVLETPNNEMRSRARKMLESLGLGEKIDANYMQLSEGQKRLCILARSMVADAKILLMDEPDSALDFGMRNTLLQIISENVQKLQGGALLSLHDINLALLYCDQIYMMKDGRIIDSVCPKEDSVSVMEQRFSNIYGRVQLAEVNKEDGTKQLVILPN